jgi:hypothetical protein
MGVVVLGRVVCDRNNGEDAVSALIEEGAKEEEGA